MVATHPSRAEFDPAPDTADDIIDALADPAATLRDVARAFATTIEPLARWLQRPEILARLDLIEAAITRRARFLAAHALPSVVKSLTLTIDHHHAEEAKAEATNAEETKASEANALNFPTSTPTPAALTRARDAARKAAGLLLRIAKWTSPDHERPKAVLKTNRDSDKAQRNVACVTSTNQPPPRSHPAGPSLSPSTKHVETTARHDREYETGRFDSSHEDRRVAEAWYSRSDGTTFLL